jgi:hypothetical protein
MKDLIACCGIDCESCDARIATVNNDDKMREETAQKWNVQFNSTDITADSINCTGCRIEGPNFAYCTICEIRSCVQAKGFITCGDCEEIDACKIVGSILEHVPGAKANLTDNGA